VYFPLFPLSTYFYNILLAFLTCLRSFVNSFEQLAPEITLFDVLGDVVVWRICDATPKITGRACVYYHHAVIALKKQLPDEFHDKFFIFL
jgi:hypothetical protein